MIEIQSVSKQFGKLSALNNVNLSLQQGECLALIGPNGCGKTTLIKSILGMVIPTQGEIRVNGKPIRNEVNYRSDIGYMPQIGSYPKNLSIGQVIDMLVQIREKTHGQPNCKLIQELGLEKLFHKRIGTLSGGTLQKVSAAIAFLFDPGHLILDEPTAGLDPISSSVLRENIQQAHGAGKMVLITSHILSELDELISDIIYMEEGKLVFKLNLAELKNATGEEKLSSAITSYLKRTVHG